MAPPVPQSDQFLEVLNAIEALNVEAERLQRALDGARQYMTAESEQRASADDEPDRP